MTMSIQDRFRNAAERNANQDQALTIQDRFKAAAQKNTTRDRFAAAAAAQAQQHEDYRSEEVKLIDKIRNMPKEEWDKLPEDKKSEYERIIQKQNLLESFEGIMGDQFFEELKEEGQMSRENKKTRLQKIAGGLVGGIAPFKLIGKALVEPIAKRLIPQAAKVIGTRFAPTATHAGVWAGTGVAINTAEKLVKGEGLPTPEEMAVDAATFAGFELGARALGYGAKIKARVNGISEITGIPKNKVYYEMLSQASKNGLKLEEISGKFESDINAAEAQEKMAQFDNYLKETESLIKRQEVKGKLSEVKGELTEYFGKTKTADEAAVRHLAKKYNIEPEQVDSTLAKVAKVAEKQKPKKEAPELDTGKFVETVKGKTEPTTVKLEETPESKQKRIERFKEETKTKLEEHEEKRKIETEKKAREEELSKLEEEIAQRQREELEAEKALQEKISQQTHTEKKGRRSKKLRKREIAEFSQKVITHANDPAVQLMDKLSKAKSPNELKKEIESIRKAAIKAKKSIVEGSEPTEAYTKDEMVNILKNLSRREGLRIKAGEVARKIKEKEIFGIIGQKTPIANFIKVMEKATTPKARSAAVDSLIKELTTLRNQGMSPEMTALLEEYRLKSGYNKTVERRVTLERKKTELEKQTKESEKKNKERAIREEEEKKGVELQKKAVTEVKHLEQKKLLEKGKIASGEASKEAHAEKQKIKKEINTLKKTAKVAKPIQVQTVTPQTPTASPISAAPAGGAVTPTKATYPNTHIQRIVDQLNDSSQKLMGTKETPISKQGWELVHNLFGKKWFSEYQTRLKWLVKCKETFKSKQDRSDMIYYIEHPKISGKGINDPGTGNPMFSKTDTYADLVKRISPEAKDFVDKTLRKHFAEMLIEHNKSPYTKKISPREFLENYYLPHFYEGNIKQAAELLSKRFKTGLSLAKQRKFLTINDAVKAGLTPKYNDIFELMYAYDTLMMRSRLNSEFAAKINELQKNSEVPLIVRTIDKDWALFKKNGYVPYEDPYLRRYIAGRDAKGNPIYATTEGPVLIHPDLARSLPSIFVREFQSAPAGLLGKIGRPIVNAYRIVNDFIKSRNVSFSRFHGGTLGDVYKGSVGMARYLKDVVFGKGSFQKRMAAIRNDPTQMKEPLEAGLNIHAPHADVGDLGGGGPLNTLINKMKLKGGIRKKLANLLEKTEKFNYESGPFKDFHPNLKLSSYFHQRDAYLRDFQKQNGRMPTDAERVSINRKIAKLVNDQFGGQRFESLEHLNDAQVMRKIAGAIAFPDWTMSAIREVGNLANRDPLIRKAAGKYFGKYIGYLVMEANLRNFFYTGLYNKQDGSVGFDWDKAHSTFTHKDPKAGWLDVQLPDLTYTVNGVKYNTGRDENGRTLYTHRGKKLLEIIGYLKDPLHELFNKSNPALRWAVEEIFGHGLSIKGDDYPTQAGNKYGKWGAWQGSKFGTPENLWERMKHTMKMPIPFSAGTLVEHGIVPFILSGFGSASIKKGSSTNSLRSDIQKALEKGDIDTVNKYKQVLRDEGYSSKVIDASITRIRNEIKSENKKTKK